MSGFFSKSYANHQWNLLEGYDPYPAEFKEREIGKRIVYWKIRMLGKARVQKDKIIYQFDKESKEIVDVIVRWRDDLPSVLPELKITKEKAESMVEGKVQLSQLYILSPKSVVFSTVRPTPENPCWVVASADEAKGLITTVIDALEGKILGYGIPPPYTAFSLSGPQEQNPCSGVWRIWYENAQEWFDVMGYSTETAESPTEAKVQGHIQSQSTAMFYELAHGAADRFASGCDNGFYEITWADEIEDWISSYTKMPFTFLGSCEGMCETGDDTLSYEFRKGSTEDTATVGFCHMDVAPCLTDCWWEDAFNWQDTLFECMSEGDTVRDAFDTADGLFPDCRDNECMRFAGDEDFAVVPIVFRVYDPISHWMLDETSGTIAEDSIGDNDGTLLGDPIWRPTDGKIDGALELDGNGDYVSLYPISSLGGDSVTITAWINANDVSEGLHPIFTQFKQLGVDYYGYYFYVSGNKPTFYLGGDFAQSSEEIDQGSWYHLAGTYDGSDLKIYVNGVQRGTDSSSKTGISHNAYIGHDDVFDDNFSGLIDDVRIYDWAMDQTEILEIMSEGTTKFSVKDSIGDIVAWFDEFGNLFLTGTLDELSSHSAGGNDEFRVRDSSGDLAIIDTTDGNMYIVGEKHEDVVMSGQSPEGFIIKNSDGDVVAYIDDSGPSTELGHLYLKGKLYENH